jgi:hypothetical protein
VINAAEHHEVVVVGCQGTVESWDFLALIAIVNRQTFYNQNYFIYNE